MEDQTMELAQQNSITAIENWEVEEAEPLLIQQQQAIHDKERETSVWVQQNMIKLGKLLGADFQGHEEEALELLLQVDSCRQARRMESDSECKKTRFKGAQELKVSWNVRGLNDRDKRRIVQSLVVDWKADIICLQETKLEGDIRDIVKQVWGGRWIKFAYLEASGTRGGIMMMWDCRSWKGEVLEIGSYTLTCKFEAQLQNFSCHITGVYAPNNYIERRTVWEEVGAVRELMEGPWAVCGDFNVARFISEKRNFRRRRRSMVEFSDFIEDMNLIDLQLEDGNYTWFKGDNQDRASRIDRFLISEEWDDSFSNIKQIPLQRLASDHIPLALEGGTWNRSKNYFKFENWWLGTTGFNDRVQEWWSSFSLNLLCKKGNCLARSD
ncbi:uncharacterized protein LOC132637591 [Lycium barbarum]|uniref:uncharacterized protein LOC132637591 n=1 Tax=Lycium barbarum TaxID=112863 RepID=UPI00293EDB29|nr:uncharacterized protein LOC132637591 [Lycium barbarum]